MGFAGTYTRAGDGSYSAPCDDEGGVKIINYPWASAWQLAYGCAGAHAFVVDSGPKELGPFAANWLEYGHTCFRDGYWTD